MRKVSQLVPMELILPERYEIRLCLRDELSELSIHEYYPTDTPLDVLDETIKAFRAIIEQTGMKAKITSGSSREILLEMTGSESEVINSLNDEVALLLKWAQDSEKGRD